MELVLQDSQSTLSVSKVIFGNAFNEALVHQIIVAYAAGARQGTSAQKNRAKVTGSNKKPWRQKGTGRARSGSIKSPIWRSGGVTFAACTRNYSQKVNKKMYRAALKSILSELVRQNRLIAVDNFCVETYKTKFLAQKLRRMALKKVMIITDRIDKNLSLAARNLYKVDVRDVTSIDPLSLIIFDKVIMTSSAIKQMEKMLA